MGLIKKIINKHIETIKSKIANNDNVSISTEEYCEFTKKSQQKNKKKKYKIVLIDRFRSCITHEQIRKFKEQARITNPANYSQKIMPDKTLDEVIHEGIKLMKKDGFKIATEEVVKGL